MKTNTNTRSEFRAYDVNDTVCGVGATKQEALADFCATTGEQVLPDEGGVDWYVLRFEQEQGAVGEWIDLDEGELVAQS